MGGTASRKATGAAIVFVAAFLILFLTMDRELNIFDEGLILVDAMRARAGELVHRDYYANYAPGMSYLVALAFALFGTSFRVAALTGIAVMAGIAATAYALLAMRVRPVLALLAPAVLVCWLAANPAYLYPSFPCALLALLAALLLCRTGAAGRAGPLLAAGGCAGLAAYFRYDTGFFLVAALAVALTIALLARAGLGGWREIARRIVLLGVGAGIVFLPGAIAFLAAAPIASFYADIIDYGLHVYPATRRLPFPGPLYALAHPIQLIAYFPLVAVIAAIPRIRADLRDPGGDRAGLPLSLALACLAGLLYYKGLVRPEPVHMMLAAIPAVPLAMLAADRYRAAAAPWKALAVALLALAALPASYAAARAVAGRPAARMPIGAIVGAGHDPADRPGEVCAAGRTMTGAWFKPEYARTAGFLRDVTAPGERIFVGVTRTSRIVVNPIALYFAADRLPMTHWAQFDPGLQTRADIQRAMLAELAAAPPRWVIRDGSNDWVREPNASAIDSNVRIVDDWLDAHYRPVARAGLVVAWLRDDVAAPPLDRGSPACRMDAPAS